MTESVGSNFRIDEIVDLGDRVLARWCWNTRGDHSRIGGELRYSEIVTYRGGRAILIEHFRDQSEALKAVGLTEDALGGETEDEAVAKETPLSTGCQRT